MSDTHGRHFTGLALYLAVVQFLVLLTWTVYVVYLPGLLDSVGIDQRWAGWILLADQVLFACFDILAGFMADRAFRLYARIGYAVLGVTALSCAAFIALPLLPALEVGPAIFLGVIALWAIGSAALRAPLFALLARHAALPDVPQLAGLTLFGMGLAAAISPYLGMLLKEQAPILPFLVASLALMSASAGVIVAERRQPPPPRESVPPPEKPIPAWAWLPALLLAAFAFQVAVFINAAPRYLSELDAAWLPWLMPVSWGVFSIIASLIKPFAKRWAPGSLFLFGCLAGTTGLILIAWPGIGAAIAGYALVGAGWGLVMPSVFGFATASGQRDRIGTYTGLLFATLASAAFMRIGLTLSGWPKMPDLTEAIGQIPIVAWLCGGAVIFVLLRAGFGRRSSKPG